MLADLDDAHDIQSRAARREVKQRVMALRDGVQALIDELSEVRLKEPRH